MLVLIAGWSLGLDIVGVVIKPDGVAGLVFSCYSLFWLFNLITVDGKFSYFLLDSSYGGVLLFVVTTIV